MDSSLTFYLVLGALLAGFIVLGMLKGMIKMLLFGAAVLSAVAAYFWLSKYGFTYLSFITSDPREWMVSVLSIGGALAVFFVFMHGLFWFSDVFSWGRRMGFGGAKGVVTTLLMAAVVCWVGVMCIFYYGSMAEMTRARELALYHMDPTRAISLPTIYAVKKESPLIVGWGEGENFVASDMLAGMQPGDKAALLMVHFGTTYDDTRTKTIDAINAKAKEAFPQMEMREAYTSRIVMRRLKVRGIEKPNPLEALLKLLGDGYTHVIVQSTNIIEGVEMESLRRDVASVARFFKEIRVGNPLLYSVEDAEAVVDILGASKPEKGSVVLVGHGTYTPSTATYAMIDYMLKAKGLKNFHVGTIEGYPTFDTMLQQLKDNKTKQVTLVPFMFVAGDHANNDIAVDWKEALEKEGLKVDVRMQGLGEIPAIQQQFIDHAQFMLKHKMVDIMKKKAKYAKDKDE